MSPIWYQKPNYLSKKLREHQAEWISIKYTYACHFQLQKIKDKKSWNKWEGKNILNHRETNINILLNTPSETIQAKRQWSIYKVLSGRKKEAM